MTPRVSLLITACLLLGNVHVHAKGYKPCKGRPDGECCTVCDPDDTESECEETQELETCKKGKCKSSPVYAPCDEPSEDGKQCKRCSPCDATCFETQEVKTCQGGECKSAAAAPCNCPIESCPDGQVVIPIIGGGCCMCYDPCLGKEKGESCSIRCHPKDETCMETRELRTCHDDGCMLGVPEYDACDGAKDGDTCTTCPSWEVPGGCFETKELKTCQGGKCKSAAAELKEEGESCGACFSITGDCGTCADGLSCVCEGDCANTQIADIPSTCVDLHLCADKVCGDECDTSSGLLAVMRYCQADGLCGINAEPDCPGSCAQKTCGSFCLVEGDIAGMCDPNPVDPEKPCSFEYEVVEKKCDPCAEKDEGKTCSMCHPSDVKSGTCVETQEVKSCQGGTCKSATTEECVDDPDWRKEKGSKDCAWVGKKPEKRCKKTGTGGKTANEACPKTCEQC